MLPVLAPVALGAFLTAVVVPLAKRILIGLGIGVISYVGLSALYSQVQSQVLSHWGQLPATAMQICSLGGFPQFIGIVLGAYAARVALVAVERFGRVAA